MLTQFMDKVAPYNLLRKDYTLFENTDFALIPYAKGLLLPQSVVGHALMGHSIFRYPDLSQMPFPNTAQDDVVRALGRDAREERRKRGEIISRCEDWLMNDCERQEPVDLYGKPLLGIDYFDKTFLKSSHEFHKLHMPSVRKGFVLAAHMDDWETREKCNKAFGTGFGGGEYKYVNLENMALFCDTIISLGANEHDDKAIGTLKSMGILVKFEGNCYETENIRPLYVRRKKGRGSSDDTAITIASLLYGVLYPRIAEKGLQPYSDFVNQKMDANDIAFGVFCGDAVDTWDKYTDVPVLEGHDMRIARRIMEKYPNLVSEREILEFVSCVTCPKDVDPDCSLRYFLQIDPNTQETAFETHFSYICTGEHTEQVIGFNRVLNTKFYMHLEDLLQTLSNVFAKRAAIEK